MKNILFIICLGIFGITSAQTKTAKLVTTTEKKAWDQQAEVKPSNISATADVIIDLTKTQQTIQGFGTCFKFRRQRSHNERAFCTRNWR
jgi:hypothetical protein